MDSSRRENRIIRRHHFVKNGECFRCGAKPSDLLNKFSVEYPKAFNEAKFKHKSVCHLYDKTKETMLLKALHDAIDAQFPCISDDAALVRDILI
jgi:hypothetical protein